MRRKVARGGEAQDLYVLSYMLDVALPVLVVFYVLFIAALTPGPGEVDGTSGLYKLLKGILPIGTSVGNITVHMVYVLRYGLPICLFGLMFSSRPFRIGIDLKEDGDT